MNWDAIGAIREIAIAVVVSLIYLFSLLEFVERGHF